MARGTTLANLRTMLKAELGYVLTAGVATAQDTELNQILSDMQQWLWWQYEWPFLRTKEDDSLVAGTRYYTLPAGLSYDFPVMVEVKSDDTWTNVEYGISGDQYNQVDSDDAVTRDPVERWQQYSSTQYEVWPIPASAQTLRFWGLATVGALSADGDTAKLDDLLIVLFAAAEKLARMKQPDAAAKLKRAQELFHRLKGASRPDTVFTLGSGGLSQPSTERRVITIIGSGS